MSLTPTILVVDDEAEMRALLEDELAEAGYLVVSVPSGAQALARIDQGGVDAVVTDVVMSGMKGDALLAKIHERDPEIPVIVMTAFGSIESAVDMMRSGAFHYLAKPFAVERLLTTLSQALRERLLSRELAELRAATRAGKQIMVAESAEMRRAVELVHRAAQADSPVLILGESGTGKELLARALHLESRRRDSPLVAINCSAIPEPLLESQLFGHRRGSFTDAHKDHPGLVREADGGTLFLDEIGDMPLALQAKLLRVLEDKMVHPLGASAPEPVDIRIAAATHRDLPSLSATGQFRQDLYYRLNVIAIQVPPLRERPDDLMPLVAHFTRKHGDRLGRPDTTIAREVMEAFVHYTWPGNVRELENVIERALVLGRGKTIGLEDLPETLQPRSTAEGSGDRVGLLAEVEREQIIKAMRAVGGNKTAAAKLLGLDRKTLYRKLALYEIKDAG